MITLQASILCAHRDDDDDDNNDENEKYDDDDDDDDDDGKTPEANTWLSLREP